MDNFSMQVCVYKLSILIGYKYSVGIYVHKCVQADGYPQRNRMWVNIVINPDFGCWYKQVSIYLSTFIFCLSTAFI